MCTNLPTGNHRRKCKDLSEKWSSFEHKQTVVHVYGANGPSKEAELPSPVSPQAKTQLVALILVLSSLAVFIYYAPCK